MEREGQNTEKRFESWNRKAESSVLSLKLRAVGELEKREYTATARTLLISKPTDRFCTCSAQEAHKLQQ